MTATLSPNPAEGPASLSFTGRGGEFLRLLVRGSLLQIPTFGFYRFWLITKMRRHLWANTSLSGESFEYTGTGKELLIGFLIAMAILTPVYLLYFAAGVLAEEAQVFASIPLIAIMYVLAHFGSYRARRYRATRTIFRGVRFWMAGSGWGYAMRAVAWDLANILTLGLSMPWASASLEWYRMRHTYFGTLQGDFRGTGWTLFKRGWWLWALGLALPVAIVVGTAVLLEGAPEPDETTGGILGGVIVLAILALLLAIYPAFLAVYARWQIEGTRLDGISLTANLGKGALYGPFLKLIFSSLGLVLLFGAAAAVFAMAAQDVVAGMMQGETGPGSVGAIVFAALGYLVMLLGFGIIQRYFMGRGLWAIIVSSITVENLSVIDKAVAAGQPASGLGEGLADALDFGGGV